MQLLELAKIMQESGKPENFSLLIYGNAKTGKTTLAATIAKVEQIKRVFLLDVENGRETVVTMFREGKLTPEQAAKIEIIRVINTVQRPLASETVLKLLTIHKDQTVCNNHGKIDCNDCKVDGKFTGTIFNISKLTKEDVVILDSGSAFADAVLAYYMLKNGKGGIQSADKAGWDEFGPQGMDLNNALEVIQAAVFCNFIVVTHELTVEEEISVMEGKEIKTVKIENRFPLIGTKNFCKKCAKYFGHVIYLHMGMKKHLGGSSSTYQYRTVSGSRGAWQIENSKSLDLSVLFDDLYKEKMGIQLERIAPTELKSEV